ncbi:MmgE/PrpD family protein, partial [Chloroflexota bacterium]
CLLIPGAHITPNVLPATLAIGELAGSRGKNLILAVALSHEISTRLAGAMSPHREFVTEGNDKGRVVYGNSYGYGSCIFGGIAGGAKLLGFDADKITQAMGTAGYFTPVGHYYKHVNTIPMGMAKYLSAGWISLAEMAALNLTQLGYYGDQDVLDGEFGFWKFYGSRKWEPERVIEGLGEVWNLTKTIYKPYPMCGGVFVGMECFIDIIDKNSLKPDDIQEVIMWTDPLFENTVYRNKNLRTEIEAQFSFAYAYALAAHRIKPGIEWQSINNVHSQELRQFMDKVKVITDPSFATKIIGSVTSQDPKKRWHTKVEVKARGGGNFTGEKTFAKGNPAIEETRMTDVELAKKFKENASNALVWNSLDDIVDRIFNLEKERDISSFMVCLHT